MSKYVVLDLEMCNVPSCMKKHYARKQEIIQIGAVLLDENLQITRRFNCYVRPQYGVLDTFIKRFTGIDWKNLAEAPMFDEALRAFIEWLPQEEVTVVSWSMSDKKQLQQEMEAKGVAIPRMYDLFGNWLDCQPMFAEKMGNRRCYALSEALVAADILTEGQAHNGLSDAYNTALLFAKIMGTGAWELNPYYEKAYSTEKPQPLGYSMSDLFANINLQELAIA